jgi:hypothetical protein
MVLVIPWPHLRTERRCRFGRGGREVFPGTGTRLPDSAAG